MIKTILTALMFAATLVPAQEPAAAPQEAPKVVPRPSLAANTDSRRLFFTLDELDHGRKLNTRTFEVLCREREFSTLKAGSRVPIVQGGSNIQYFDVGLNVRTHYLLRADNRLDLQVDFDMSNIAPQNANAPQSAEPAAPVIRQTRSEVAATITPDTPTILDTIEDLATGHAYQLSVLAKAR